MPRTQKPALRQSFYSHNPFPVFSSLLILVSNLGEGEKKLLYYIILLLLYYIIILYYMRKKIIVFEFYH